MDALNHQQLVQLAAEWLWRQGCSVVVTELSTRQHEIPDAIGWKGEKTILVECKTSRGDFSADSGKLFRNQSYLGVGYSRYYLAPESLIRDHELPGGWGLVLAPKLKTVVRSQPFLDRNVAGETKLLLSVIRRIGQNPPAGTLVRTYVQPAYKCTVGVIEDGDGTPLGKI